MKRSRLLKIITLIVFGSLVLSVIYIIVRIIMVPGGRTAEEETALKANTS